MSGRRMTRRGLLAAAAAAGAGLPAAAADPPAAEPYPKDAAAALARLEGGNRRFADGTTRHAHTGADWRKQLVGGQRPFATVLGCSDSRVPVELVFDQGFGDLFVVRVAGNVVADDVIGSLEYAGLHLRTPLMVVMGHTGCGAVAAAVDAKLGKAAEPDRIGTLQKLIGPGLAGLDPELTGDALNDAAVEANVRWSLRQLAAQPAAKRAVERTRCIFAGAVYDLKTGLVRLLI